MQNRPLEECKRAKFHESCALSAGVGVGGARAAWDENGNEARAAGERDEETHRKQGSARSRQGRREASVPSLHIAD